MRFGTRLNPRVEERLRGVSGGSGDELVGRLTEDSIRTEGDCLEADAELLVLDDLVGAAVLVTWRRRWLRQHEPHSTRMK